MRKQDQQRADLWLVFRVLILSALAIVAGRIATATSREGDTAFQSANDRSRWSTVAALVEDGTYQIDRLHAIQNPIHRHRYPWRSIDRVMHRGDDGKQHHYSSKPPLFPTMVAGVYWIVHQVTGMTMTNHPVYVPRIVLMLVNLPLLFLVLVTTLGVIDRLCRSQWGKYLAAASVCFGTMLLPFSVSLNNHLPAAAGIAMTMWVYFRVADRQEDSFDGSQGIHWGWWVLAGISAAFAAANELPALSILCLWVVLFGWLSYRSLLPMIAGIAIVMAAFFGTNWIAHQSLRPPYAHRGNGAQIMEIDLELTTDSTDQEVLSRVLDQVRERWVQDHGLPPNSMFLAEPSAESNRYRVHCAVGDFGLLRQSDSWKLTLWDDWYEYPGSYWQDGSRVGVDLGEPSRGKYLFHMLLGHHGVFSLSPILLLFPVGLVVFYRFGADDARRFSLAVLLTTLVCIVFYVMRPEIDRNYGGVSVCFRWFLWLIPLWLVLVAITIDYCAHNRWFRRVFYGLLAISIFSVSTSLDSAWQHPWLYRYWDFLGWLPR